jgi:hypothetical protein
MPAIVKMTLSNGNFTKRQLDLLSFSANLASIPKTASVPATVNAPLSAPMVGRIHNVKPGCGSCGRK